METGWVAFALGDFGDGDLSTSSLVSPNGMRRSCL